MCGIAGFLSAGAMNEETLSWIATRMCDVIAHRGPDDAGVWVDAAAQVALGHRRLSIVDLSAHGHQPMRSHCGRYVIIFNGEIYNNNELRNVMDKRLWTGHSDTETLLALISDAGPIAALEKIVGMFAIAVWDKELRQLTLARDRMGEKPLYYGRVDSGDFLFGSQLNALRAHPHFNASIDSGALALYMRHNAVPGELSIYVGIRKLAPGTWLQINNSGEETHGVYWSLRKRAYSLVEGRKDKSDFEALFELEHLMTQSIKGQMVADVPVGVFLSGGIDSSAVAALMCEQASGKVKTFSIGFNESGYNEAKYAKAVASYLGTHHTELYVSSEDALNLVPQLAKIYDEPFSDSSQIPTILVSKLARESVSVSLSGDGGDELFAGYNRYLISERAWKYISGVPLPLRKIASKALLLLSPSALDKLTYPLNKISYRKFSYNNVGDKLHKFARAVLPASSSQEMYISLVSQWEDSVINTEPFHEVQSLLDGFNFDSNLTMVEQMCLLDQLTYLPDDILTKIDRAAMSFGLETRVPMLDHRVVEFSWSIPMHQKIRNGDGKWLLRQLLYRRVPQSLIERPKQGFSVPLEHWLRGPLRPWAENLLSQESLQSSGLLNVVKIRQKWSEHIQGRHNWQHMIWSVLMFQSWYFEMHCSYQGDVFKK